MNKQVGNVQLMQKMNRLKVLNYIRQNPSVARPMVAEATGLSLSSITNIVTYLIEKNIVTEIGFEAVGRVGRKGILLRFNSLAYNLVCVRLEPSCISIARTDLSGNMKEKKEIKIENQEPKLIVKVLKKEIKEIINTNENVLGVGIAVSGLVLEDSRFILSSRLKWKSINVKDELEQHIGIPVFVENVSMTKAVWQFNNKEQVSSENMIFIDLEGGIGAVQFCHGVINRSLIGEIGHTTVEKEGVECFCGNKGCLEAMCSIERIISEYKKRLSINDEKINYDVILNKFSQGDKTAEKVLKECGEYLGIGLANLVNIFNPTTFILNVGEYLKCDYIFDVAIESMKERAYPILTQKLVIKKVTIGIDESIRGIAINMCDRIFDISFPNNIIE